MFIHEKGLDMGFKSRKVEAKRSEILEMGTSNAEEIQGILNLISAEYDVPDDILDELAYRMFYQDYLHENLGAWGTPRHDEFLEYEEFKSLMDDSLFDRM